MNQESLTLWLKSGSIAGMLIIKDINNPESYEYCLLDRSDDTLIDNVMWANDETGEYEVYMVNENDEPCFKRTGNKLELVTARAKGNIMLILKHEFDTRVDDFVDWRHLKDADDDEIIRN